MTTPPGPESSDHPEQSYRPDEPAGLRGYQNYPDSPAQPGDRYAGGSAEDPLVPADFGGWVRRVVEVSRRSFVPLALLGLILAVVNVVQSLILVAEVPELSQPGFGTPAAPVDPSQIGHFLTVTYATGLVSLIVSFFVQGAGLAVVIKHASGQPVTAGYGLTAAGRRAGPLIGWCVVATLITLVGFMLLIIPGIYLGVVFFSTLVGVVMVERDGLGRCFTLIRNRWWATLGRVLVLGIVLGVYSLLVYGIVGLFGSQYSIGALVVHGVLAIPTVVVSIAALTVIYAELRSHEHGAVGTPRLAAELDR